MKIFYKIFIIGTMGSGKTTLANKISEKLSIKNYSLDDIYYIKKYDKKRSEIKRKKKLKELLKKKKWIIEGVFNNWTEDIFKEANLVIWLDLNPHYIVRNLLKRFFKKEDDKANFQNIKKASKYALNYRKGSKKFVYHKLMIKKHKVNLVHIKTRRQLNDFLKTLKRKP